MTSLQPGDGHLHHPDGSHRWSGGPTEPHAREGYLAVMRDHLALHRRGDDGQPHLLAQPVSVAVQRPRWGTRELGGPS